MRKPIIVLLALWLFYAVLVLMAPAPETTSRYGLTLAQTNLLRFTIMLPLLFIWATALFSVVRFNRYRAMVKDSPEGPGFEKITVGLWMLLLVIVLPSLVNSIANYWPGNMDVQQAATITRNYISVVFYALGFWYLWQGSRALYRTTAEGLPPNHLRFTLMAIVFILVTALTWAVFNNPYRTTSDSSLIRPTYYLPDWLIVSTIILPYAVTWVMGSLAILNLLSYVRKVRGIIYRQTFSSLAYGLVVTISLLIVLQFLSQANAALGSAALKIILAIVYALLLAIAVGYLLIARGAKKLTAIEEVK
jgi:hypothetical protein